MVDRSVYAINSGPASAPLAGISVSNPFSINNVITVDMGGTSFDITLTKDGNTNLNKNIALCRIDIGHSELETEVEVGKIDGHQKRIPAKIVPFPHYDPTKSRVRS